MTALAEQAITQEVGQGTGLRLPFALETVADAYDEVHQSLRCLELTAYLVEDCVACGFVYDLDSEELIEASSLRQPLQEGHSAVTPASQRP